MCDVVWAIVELVSAVTASLTEDEGVSEGSESRTDMDWSSTREIETSHHERPTGRVPRPACNGIVDDGGPDEHEHHGWEHATSFRDGTDQECDRDAGKHTLVYCKQEIWDLG